MRIGISGSAGTGKTQLAEKLARHFKLPMFCNNVRGYLAERKISLSEARQDMKRFQQDLLNRRILAESGSFVADRTSVDNLAYTLFHAGQISDNDWIENYYETAIQLAYEYDVLVYLPWGGIPAEDDGVRNMNTWYNLTVASIILGLTKKAGNLLDLTDCPAENYFCEVVKVCLRHQGF
jgi:nicotinamide riboside kinase